MSYSSGAILSCPSCGGGRVRIFYEALSAPVNSVLLLSSRERALGFPRGDIRLGFCEDCGFVFNTSFVTELVEYSSRCEETQGFSPHFREWHEGLARRLIKRYSLHQKKIIEIGCGKGEFLAMLCDMGENRGIGFDPAYIPERTPPELASRIHFIADLYSANHTGLEADFVCCKMTLEHIANTREFIRMVSRSLSDSPEAIVFFQVPDLTRILEEGAFWDIYYEHCSYFTAGSLARLFHRAGLDVIELGREYGGQYVTIEARMRHNSAPRLVTEDNLGELKMLLRSFETRVPGRIAEWRQRLENCRQKGAKTVVWGAGSKGVTFLSTLDVPDAIEYAVDINPNMWGHYLAKSGVKIIGPSVLREYRPDLVIVMNPVYCEEVAAELAKLDLRPEVISK